MPKESIKRKCGDCTLCCRLLPVPEHGKPADAKCPHQFSKGCRIYSNRPQSCAYWNCRWLAGDDTGQRPDRAHYVVDMMPDFVTKTDDHTGEEVGRHPVLQIWVEAGHIDEVLRDRSLLAYIEHMGATEGMCALLRVANRRGVFIAPPSITRDGKFHIQESRSMTHEHTFEEIAAAQHGDFSLTVVVPQDRVQPKTFHVDTAEDAFDILRNLPS